MSFIFILISINFNPKKFFKFIKKTYAFINKKNRGLLCKV